MPPAESGVRQTAEIIEIQLQHDRVAIATGTIATGYNCNTGGSATGYNWRSHGLRKAGVGVFAIKCSPLDERTGKLTKLSPGSQVGT